MPDPTCPDQTCPDQTFPDLTCHVFAAEDFRATIGANVGDPLGCADDLSLGDSYELRRDATPFRVVMTATSADRARQRIAPGSDIGRAGDEIRITARLTLMSPDGQCVEVLVLEHLGARGRAAGFVLPLSPIEARTEYTLLKADADPGELRLSDVICASFGAGTRITLADGRQRAIELLEPGDRVLTRDHGAQPVRWNGKATLRAIGGFAPVVIPAGIMGNVDDLIVSQHHRLFLYHRRIAQLTGMPELLVQAGQLVHGGIIYVREGGYVDYHALVFDHHEIIYAEGIPAESLMLAEATLSRLPPDLAEGVKAHFPGVAQPQHFGFEAGADLVASLGHVGLMNR